MREITLCDICEGSDCSDTCSVRASEQRSAKSAFDGDESESRAFANSSAYAKSTFNLIIFTIIVFSMEFSRN